MWIFVWADKAQLALSAKTKLHIKNEILVEIQRRQVAQLVFPQKYSTKFSTAYTCVEYGDSAKFFFTGTRDTAVYHAPCTFKRRYAIIHTFGHTLPVTKGIKEKIDPTDRTPRETLEKRLEETSSNARCFAQGFP